MTVRFRLDWDGQRVTERTKAAAVRGLGKDAEHLLGESRQEVPIEEATLERSGVASVDEDTMSAAVSYDTPYAVRQHEDLTYRHDPGRKAKYLEDPFNRERGTMLEILAAEIRRELE
ncbi:hypothetical protein [Thermomonospora cellulosilytica]|uniref:Phage protein, HK97 gp10 family n=1 Tax=Thermomonospora cellulosilytica TaxID=1411118 RepID=A0A7W3MXD5_9ACTN|nr:hypothetical protein [Thermomonospora cellulosilytica]MBA9003663.1 hypothetical protein [Thermomonospora cellulosilytica]